MTMTLNAGFVYGSEDEDAVIVGFADQEYYTHKYVLLQRSRQVSAEEETLGQGEVHIAINDERCSAYGAVERIVLSESQVTIRLNVGVAASIGVDDQIAICFAAEAVDLMRLQADLKLLCSHRTGLLKECA